MSVAARANLRGEAEVRLLAALVRAKGLDDVDAAALDALVSATRADRVAILRFDDDGAIRFNAWRGLSAEYREAVTGHTPWTRGSRDAHPMAVADVLREERLRDCADVFMREGIRALAFIPLELDAGVFAQFMLCYAERCELDEEDLTIAQAIAGHVAFASEIARETGERMRLLADEHEARRIAELLNRVAPVLNTELDLEKFVQAVTDVATEIVGAEFGSFFHNVVNERGECYMLYTLSGVPREAFAQFPMPRNTELFGPTFRGEGVVRCEDVTQDPRYGKNAPYYGMPKGHLAVRSYLAAPVVSRGEVLGGLFFGHSVPGKFTENHETLIRRVASQAAVAMDNARLFEQSQWVQNELKRSNEELRRANQDLETFAYSASHDLNEPLRTISLSAELLERNCGNRLEGDTAKFLAGIRHGARRMESLIQDLLAYTKAARYEDSRPPGADTGRVLASVLENLKGPLEQAGAAVTQTALPVVAMHESRLGQVLQNLIGNALKYRGAEPPQVHISASEQDGWCVLSVADNGIGIEPRFADLIFGLFKRLHTQDQYPGSGIGLSICQRIVERYGGRIWLEKSISNQGSTFCFSVPIRGQ